MNRESYKNWYEKNKDKARKYKATNMKKYRAENPEKFKEMARRRVKERRNKLLKMYGEVCAICGFSDCRALTLDHIAGNGNEERRRIGEQGIYRKALKEYHPDLYRTLCMNCQFIERRK